MKTTQTSRGPEGTLAKPDTFDADALFDGHSKLGRNLSEEAILALIPEILQTARQRGDATVGLVGLPKVSFRNPIKVGLGLIDPAGIENIADPKFQNVWRELESRGLKPFFKREQSSVPTFPASHSVDAVAIHIHVPEEEKGS